MEEVIKGFDKATGTFYAASTLEATGKDSALVVYVPPIARMVSLDIAVEDGAVFSVFVTNSTYDEAVEDGDTVTWYPTVHQNVYESIFTTKSACAGAYKVVFTSGKGVVKVRAK